MSKTKPSRRVAYCKKHRIHLTVAGVRSRGCLDGRKQREHGTDRCCHFQQLPHEWWTRKAKIKAKRQKRRESCEPALAQPLVLSNADTLLLIEEAKDTTPCPRFVEAVRRVREMEAKGELVVDTSTRLGNHAVRLARHREQKE